RCPALRRTDLGVLEDLTLVGVVRPQPGRRPRRVPAEDHAARLGLPELRRRTFLAAVGGTHRGRRDRTGRGHRAGNREAHAGGARDQDNGRDQPAGQALRTAAEWDAWREAMTADLRDRLRDQADDEVQPGQPDEERDDAEDGLDAELAEQYVAARDLVGPRRTEEPQEDVRDAADDRQD